MADAWGGSWGQSWGDSWSGAGVAAPPGRVLDALWTPPSYNALWTGESHAALWSDDLVIRTDFNVLKGEAPTFRFTASPAVDITGRTIVMYVSRDGEQRGQAANVPLVTVNGAIVTAATGIFTTTLTSDQTKTTLGVGRWRYDVWFTDTGAPVTGGTIHITTAARW